MSTQSGAERELSLMASAVACGGRTERRTEAKRIRILIVLRKRADLEDSPAGKAER